MHTPDIRNYSVFTEEGNRAYADQWGYGFHVFDHIVDLERVPHWSKLHAVQLYLSEYEYLLWIDADAVFFDRSRGIDEVFNVSGWPNAEMWAQDIWPDYPSVQRMELIDTGVVLFRNSLWTRQFLLEMYHLPSCQNFLNWTEQYCFTVAYREDFLGMRSRMAILPTPTINHHVLPSPQDPAALFILHLAGRPTKARTTHFSQVQAGRPEAFRTEPQYEAFWRFRELFSRHAFGGIASQQVCLFGLGPRSRALLDATLFHFPYVGVFTVVLQGTPQLYSQMKATEEIGERFPERMAHMDIREYMLGTTRDGEKFVEGFFCDVFFMSAESSRHIPDVEALGRLAKAGLEEYKGEKNKGFGFSAIRDAYFVWFNDGCAEDADVDLGARGLADPDESVEVKREALTRACGLLGETRAYVDEIVASTGGHKGVADAEVDTFGDVVMARVNRQAFFK